MNTYAYLIKAKAKAANAKSFFCWFSAKSDSRADRQILDILEDAEIETGRGADHQLPIRTNFPVVDDLPDEGILDDTWCDRYDYDNGTTWQKTVIEIAASLAAQEQEQEQEQPIHSTPLSTADENLTYNLALLPFRVQLLAQFLTEEKHASHISWPTKCQIADLEMDTDNNYIQNLLLAAENNPKLKDYDLHGLWKVTTAVKKVFPVDKRHELGTLITFIKLWLEHDHIDRGILVREWANGNRISAVQRNNSGANAGGGNQTDRNPDLVHTFDVLDKEIALATLPMDFNIYDLPGSIYRRAKEIVQKKESPFKEWSVALRATPGILDYSRAAIFALIRSAEEHLTPFPDRLRGYICANLTETNHANPTPETLAAARHVPELDAAEEVNRLQPDEPAENNQPKLANAGGGIFTIEGLAAPAPAPAPAEVTTETEDADNVPMEEAVSNEEQTGAVPAPGEAGMVASESGTVDREKADPVNNDTRIQNSDPLYTHLMVDLETMASGPDAPIVSIGAVFFDPATGQLGPDFYKAVSLESAMAWGGVPEASTIIWWLKQSAEARSAIAMDDAIPLDDALLQLNDFISENAANGPASIQVWGNGATFDNVILRSSYDRTGIDCPWRFVNDRDVRTIVELGKSVGCEPRYKIQFVGDQHNALADARHQAKYVSVIWQRLTATSN